MIPIQRSIYLAGIILLAMYQLLFPTWIGRIYDIGDLTSAQTWNCSGYFGLKGAAGSFYKRAPIWRPPTADSDAIHPSVRWPWQAQSTHEHVELALAVIVARWSVGILLLGLIVSILNRISPSEKPEAVLAIAWSISVSLVIAWLSLFVLASISMGYAVTDAITIAVFSISVLAGLAWGLGTHWRKRL